jgi:hypothetical protein
MTSASVILLMDTNITDIRAVVPPLTEASLCTWLGAAAPGDSITYHRGALARQVCPQLRCLTDQERTALRRLAARAWKLAELGLADIVQRRHGYEDYAYILVARRRPRRDASSILPLLLAEAA